MDKRVDKGLYEVKISCKPSSVPIPASCKIGPSSIIRFDAYPTLGHTKQSHAMDSYTTTHGGSLIPDICKNYDPIKSQPKNSSTSKLGRLYQCNNFESHEGLKDGCLFCCHWVTFEGEDKGHKSTPEKMVAYYVSLYNEDSNKFIRFFKKRKDYKDKKKILEGLLECDFVNEEVIKYLDESWPNLVREVGLSLV